MIMSACTVFCAFIGIFALTLLVIKLFGFDYAEVDALEDAEWIIIDHCNSTKDCTECNKYLKKKKMCRYRVYAPWNWRCTEEDGREEEKAISESEQR